MSYEFGQLSTRQFAKGLTADGDIIAAPGSGYKILLMTVNFGCSVAESGKKADFYEESATEVLGTVNLGAVESSGGIDFAPTGYLFAENKAFKCDTNGSTGKAVFSGVYAVVPA